MPLLLLVAAAVTSIAQPATDLFLENRGQFAAPIYFGGRLAGSGDVAFLPNSVDFSWTVRSAQTGELRDHPLRMTFLGSNPLVQPIGIDPTPTVHHFYHGSAAAPIENVRSFAAIRYDRLYHGIDAIYRVDPEQGLKYDLVVAPGAIPQQIVISYDGAEGALSIDASGRLVIPTRFGRLLEAAPYSYQEIDGKRVEIDVRYQLIGSDRFGFAIGTYDPSYPLVIDPCLAIEYLTYLGGGGYDEVTAMATDSAGFGYTVGMTRAINFIFFVLNGKFLIFF